MDDGSGVISCRSNKNTPELEKIEQLRLASQNDSSIMVNLYIKLILYLLLKIILQILQLISNQDDDGIETLLNLLEKEKSAFTIGDTIQVKGKLSFYKEEWKMFGNTIRILYSIYNLLTFFSLFHIKFFLNYNYV